MTLPPARENAAQIGEIPWQVCLQSSTASSCTPSFSFLPLRDRLRRQSGGSQVDQFGATAPLIEALAIDTLLLGLFAVSTASWRVRRSSAGGRASFRRPSSAAPMCSSRAWLLLLFWQWRPIAGAVWSVEQPFGAVALLGASSGSGWVHASCSHVPDRPFRAVRAPAGLCRLRRSRAAEPVQDAVSLPAVRHPIISASCSRSGRRRTMTAGHLLFAIATTGYILLGIARGARFIRLFGDRYRRYREEVGMLVPWSRRGRIDRPIATSSVDPGQS